MATGRHMFLVKGGLSKWNNADKFGTVVYIINNPVSATSSPNLFCSCPLSNTYRLNAWSNLKRNLRKRKPAPFSGMGLKTVPNYIVYPMMPDVDTVFTSAH